MKQDTIHIFVQIEFVIVAIAITFLVFLLFYRVFSPTKVKNASTRFYNQLEEKLKQIDLTKKQQWYSKKGIMYRMKDYDLAPAKYILVKLTIATIINLIYIIFFKVNIWYMLCIEVIGYFLVDLYFIYENHEDNKEIFKDIYKLYLSMHVNLNSNLYIVDTILKCAELANSKRLKKELLELAQNLSSKVYTIEEAITIFQKRFDSPHIKSFSNLLNNYYLYGKNDNYIEDLMNEVASITSAKAIKDQEDIENRGQFLTMMFFVIIMAMIVYILFDSLKGIQLF